MEGSEMTKSERKARNERNWVANQGKPAITEPSLLETIKYKCVGTPVTVPGCEYDLSIEFLEKMGSRAAAVRWMNTHSRPTPRFCGEPAHRKMIASNNSEPIPLCDKHFEKMFPGQLAMAPNVEVVYQY